MSGGSLDYVCFKLDDAIGTIRSRGATSPLHLAFAEHLELVSAALHDLEWVWSGDQSEGDEETAIRKVLAPGATLGIALRQAEEAVERLRAEIASTRPDAADSKGERE